VSEPSPLDTPPSPPSTHLHPPALRFQLEVKPIAFLAEIFDTVHAARVSYSQREDFFASPLLTSTSTKCLHEDGGIYAIFEESEEVQPASLCLCLSVSLSLPLPLSVCLSLSNSLPVPHLPSLTPLTFSGCKIVL
jgi:hypothetical protein